MSQKDLDSLSGKLEKIFKDKSKTRRQYNRNYGQVFIFDENLSKGVLLEALTESQVPNPETVANSLVRKMKIQLAREDSYGKKSYGMNRAREYRDRIKAGEVPNLSVASGHAVYAVRSYNTVNKIKSDIGKLLERYTRRFGSQTASAASFTGADNKSGIQLGHGDMSASIAHVKSLKVEQALAKFGSNSQELIDGIDRIRKQYNESVGLNISLSHEQALTSRGGFKKGYTAVFSSQATLENQMDAKDERAFLSEIEKYLTENVVNLKGSPSLKDSLTTTLLYNFSSKKHIKVKSKTKRSDSSSATSKKKSKLMQSQPEVARGGVVARMAPKKQARKGASNVPLAMIQVFNSKLPQKIAKNMKSPRLNYQTGRFAESVRVTDVIKTPEGFSSFGFTYQKNPYQTFEPGYAQGSVDRDPRKLIDRSMREIAAEFAIGRFYTRRV